MKTKSKKATPAGRLRRLVLRVVKALASTNGSMMWDIDPDKPAIKDMLQDEIKTYSASDAEAVESVLKQTLRRHCETMKGAVEYESDQAESAAILFSQQNAQAQTPPDSGTKNL